jgi:hypothetical protein
MNTTHQTRITELSIRAAKLETKAREAYGAFAKDLLDGEPYVLQFIEHKAATEACNRVSQHLAEVRGDVTTTGHVSNVELQTAMNQVVTVTLRSSTVPARS